MQIIDIVKTSLAIYLIARLVSRERGFYGIFAKARLAIIPKIIRTKFGSEIVKSIGCPYCFTMFCSLFIIPIAIVGYVYEVYPLRLILDSISVISLVWMIVKQVGMPDEPDNTP